MNLFPDLPAGWREERIHDVADLRTSSVDKKSQEDENSVELCNYVDVYKNDKITAGLEFMKATATVAQIDRFSVCVGDVIITKDSETPSDIGIPAYVAETKPSLVCGYHLTMIRPNEEFVEGSYLFYAVKSRLSAYQFYLAANGVTRFGLTSQGTKNLRIAFPSTAEQKQIANFLDWKTEQIDALIAKKKQLIEKLKEQRIAVITQAVTKGLNPEAPLRDSGIPWLGEVPAHWKPNFKLSFLATSEQNSFVNGPFGSDLLTSELVDEGIPVLYSGEVKATKFIRKSGKFVTEEKATSLDFCRADPGDVLMAKVGAPPGDACVYPEGSPAAIVTQDVVRIRIERNAAHSEYLSYLLVSTMGRHLVRLVSVESTRGRFSLADLKSIRFPIPPVDEQIQISKHVTSELNKVDHMHELNLRTIDRLTEYRTALITAATTGKIDVREIEIPSPELPQHTESA